MKDLRGVERETGYQFGILKGTGQYGNKHVPMEPRVSSPPGRIPSAQKSIDRRNDRPNR